MSTTPKKEIEKEEKVTLAKPKEIVIEDSPVKKEVDVKENDEKSNEKHDEKTGEKVRIELIMGDKIIVSNSRGEGFTIGKEKAHKNVKIGDYIII